MLLPIYKVYILINNINITIAYKYMTLYKYNINYIGSTC